MLTYSVLRLLIFAACLGLLWLCGLRSADQQLLLVVLAGLLSMAVSFVALRGPREQLSSRITERVARSTVRRGEQTDDETAEDREAS